MPAKENVVLILDATTAKESLQPLECEGRVSSLVFSHDRTRLATFEEGGKIKVWHLTTGKLALVVNKGRRSVDERILSFSPDRKLLVLTGSYYDEDQETWVGEIRLVDMTDGSDFKHLIGHANPKVVKNNPLFLTLLRDSTLSSARFSPDGNYLVSSGYDKTVRVWSTATGEQVRILKSHTDRVRSVAFSPDGLSLLLRILAHEVQVAYDGPSALESAAEFRPEVILLDLSLLGRVNNYEVAKRMRQLSGGDSALLIAVSGAGQGKPSSTSTSSTQWTRMRCKRYSPISSARNL